MLKVQAFQHLTTIKLIIVIITQISRGTRAYGQNWLFSPTTHVRSARQSERCGRT